MMKFLAHLSVLLLAFLSFGAFAQNNEVRNLDKFTKIINASSANIYLKQGSPQKVTIEGKKDLVANVLTEVSDGKLKIRTKDHDGSWSWIHEDGDLRVYITVENLDGIDINGSGDFTAQTKIVGSSMAINVNGSGTVDAEMDITGLTEAYVAGSGDVSLKGKFGHVKTQVSGSGDIEFNAAVAGQAEFNVSGSGDITARGKASVLIASVSGSGDLNAADFETDKCTVRVSGSGDAQVYAKVELEARTSGSGDIAYRGNPTKIDTHNSGSGSVGRI